MLSQRLLLLQLKKYLRNKAGSSDYKNASEVMKGTLVKCVNFDITPYLNNIKPETLLVFGTNDTATPLWMGKLFGWGGVIWNEDLDLDSDTIYEDGKTVKSEANATELIIGYNIKQARLKKQLTQEELSKLTKINQSDISRIESGKLSPSLSTIKKIAKSME